MSIDLDQWPGEVMGYQPMGHLYPNSMEGLQTVSKKWKFEVELFKGQTKSMLGYLEAVMEGRNVECAAYDCSTVA
jgi:hypothetical protein